MKYIITSLCLFAVWQTGFGQADTLIQTPLPQTEEGNRKFILPLATFSPETSLRLGAVGIYIFRLPNAQPGTLLSSIKTPITYTLLNQIKARFSFEVFMNENKHIYEGFVQWQRFPLLFYGIGPDSPEAAEELYTSRNYGGRFSYLNRVSSRIYVGGQFEWNNTRIVERDELGLLAQDGLVPGSNGGTVAGLGLSMRYDRRDNNFNASRGPFLDLKITTFNRVFSSDFDFTKFTLDMRHFVEVMDKHVLAFQILSEYNWGGPSFETMALLGGDIIMRGHIQGRFRDKAFWAAQTEYRLPINRAKWFSKGLGRLSFWEKWGLVGFAGFGTVAPRLADMGSSALRYSVGVGIRFLVLPEERVNVRLDFGFGTQQPGFYFNIREAF